MATWDISGVKTSQATPISINFSSSGDNTVVTGVSGQTIRVWRIFFVVSIATNVTFKDGSTALSGALNLAANSSVTFDEEGDPWFVTSSGNNFVINQSANAQVSGVCYYTQS